MNRHWLRGQHLLDLGRFADAAKEFGRSISVDDESYRADARAMLAL